MTVMAVDAGHISDTQGRSEVFAHRFSSLTMSRRIADVLSANGIPIGMHQVLGFAAGFDGSNFGDALEQAERLLSSKAETGEWSVAYSAGLQAREALSQEKN